MKRIVLILLTTLLCLNWSAAFSQPFIDNVFNKYSGQSGFTSIMITPQLFKLLTLIDSKDQDLQKISEKLTSLKILVSEGKNVGFTNEVREKLKASDYLNIMEVVDGKSKVNFFVKQNANTITDFVLIAVDDREEVLLSITGNLKMDEISALGRSSSIGGAGHLTLLKNLEK